MPAVYPIAGQHFTETRAVSRDIGSMLRFLVLIGVFPMFFQIFHYMIDVYPVYIASKAWPLVTLPLCLYFFFRPNDVPMRVFYLIFLSYVFLIPTTMAMIYFGQSYISSLTTLAKSLPLFYYLSLLAVFILLKVQPREIEKAFIWLGVLTFVIMGVLWVVVPDSWYDYTPVETRVFLKDLERGNRLAIPMFFGAFFIFYQFRQFLTTQRLWRLAAALLPFLLYFITMQARTNTVGILAVMGVAAMTQWRTRGRVLIGMGGLLVLFLGIVLWPEIRHHFDPETLGGSLSVRQHSTNIALKFLGDDFNRWLVGVGATSRVSDVSLKQQFNFENFFLADIGWLGIMFEYGVIGAILILGFYLRVYLFRFRQLAHLRTPFVDALGDYVLYLLLTSAILSLMFTPGEIAGVMAIFAFLAMQRRGI